MNKTLSRVIVAFGLAGPLCWATPPDGAKEVNAGVPRGLYSTVIKLKRDEAFPAEFRAELPPVGAPLMGGRPHTLERIKILVIPVRSSSKHADPPPVSVSELKALFFGDLMRQTQGARASVADYFRAASFGAVTSVTGRSCGLDYAGQVVLGLRPATRLA